jgi:hypothetical protein
VYYFLDILLVVGGLLAYYSNNSTVWTIYCITAFFIVVGIVATLIGTLIARLMKPKPVLAENLLKLDQDSTESLAYRRPSMAWPILTVVLALVAIYYQYLHFKKLDDTAALYIGVPFILALGLSLTSRSKSALGATIKGITIAMLLSAIVFREGYICILFASPLFYAVGALVAAPIDRARKQHKLRNKVQASVVATLIALLSLEGTTTVTSMPRENEVFVSKIVAANIGDIRDQLSATPRFDRERSVFLDIFPYPQTICGQGLNVGDERKLNFVAYKQIWWGKVSGDLVLKVSESTPQQITFSVVKDDSYLSHYLKWQSSIVSLTPIDQTHTNVTWKLTYKRILDPSWYFGVMQRFAVKRVAEELIDNVATPLRKT